MDNHYSGFYIHQTFTFVSYYNTRRIYVLYWTSDDPMWDDIFSIAINGAAFSER